MDLVASCKDKLPFFRIKELKDVLTQLGVSKQGKKQDLVDRILSVLSEEQASKIWTKKKSAGREEVAKLIDDIYRKMQGSGANDLASKGQGASDSSSVKTKGEIDDHFQSTVKVRCPCGSSLETESMIKCEDTRCHVWQHIRCVIIPEKPMEGGLVFPSSFYCELCRLNRADPFWVTVTHPLSPVKLTATNIPTDGSNPIQSVERTFQITRAEKDLLAKQEYDVQAWCMLLNDKVQFRMHWPQYADLQVNGVPIRAINRPGSQLLGANGRDDGPIITPWTKDGINKISLTASDARIFCFGVKIVKRRTIQQVLKLIPKEPDGEHFEDALARVCRCVGGGTGAGADSDSDIELVEDFFTVNLRCPMSGSRIKIAGRFKPCAHMGCFDLEVFVELNQRSKKWQCPICLKNYSLESIIIDPYFNRITSKMKDCGEDLAELEVKPDGSWRAKCKNEFERRELRDLADWHLPDGTLCPPVDAAKQKVQASAPVKLEGISENHNGLKLGIRKNPNGLWEVSRPERMCTPSSGIRLEEKLAYHGQKVIPMSSSASGNGGREGEDPSVNQDGGGTFDLANNGVELDSMHLNIDSPYGFSDRNPSAPTGNAAVIVLSDSDEENDMPISSGPAYNDNQTDGRVTCPITSSGIADSYPDDSTLGNNGRTSCLDLYNGIQMPLWQMPSGTQGGSGFQLFASDADVSGALLDLQQHDSVNCEPSINGYTNGSETAMGLSHLVQDSVGRSAPDIHDGFVDYPFIFGGDDDPSLQIFLPTRPLDESALSDMRNQADVSNGLRSDDWISLRLGDGAGAGHGEPSTANGFITHQHVPSNVISTSQHVPSHGLNTSHHLPSNGLNTSQHMPLDGLDTSQVMPSTGIDTGLPMVSREATSLLGTNDVRPEKASRQSSDNPFTFPRQKRSVRPRLYLSIDSNSE